MRVYALSRSYSKFMLGHAVIKLEAYKKRRHNGACENTILLGQLEYKFEKN